MIVLIIVCGVLLYCIIRGILQYIRNPKPPKSLKYRELYQYYDSLNYAPLEEVEEENESEKLKLEKEIEFYMAQIAMLEDLERIIEKDIQKGNGSEKVNLSRIISIDKQIHSAQKKIDKLNNELESL